MTLDREPPASMLKTASESSPSAWPVHVTPRSYMTIPPSNEAPAAIVWAAESTEVPEDAGREPPDEPEPEEETHVVVAAVVAAEPPDDAALEEPDFLVDDATALSWEPESAEVVALEEPATVVDFEDFLVDEADMASPEPELADDWDTGVDFEAFLVVVDLDSEEPLVVVAFETLMIEGAALAMVLLELLSGPSTSSQLR